MTHPLIEQATKKAGIVWIGGADGPAYALWCLPVDGGLALVLGPQEQEPADLSLRDGDTVSVTLRGDHGGAIVRYPARADLVSPGSEAWDEIAPQLAAKRLNATGATEDVVKRWAADCTVWRLAPNGDPAAMGESSGAAEPRPSTATNQVRKPFKLHRNPRKRT